MSDQFFDPSEKILNMKVGNPIGLKKYPWREVPIGKSFTINNKNDIKFKVLRSLASKMGKKIGRKFRVAEHPSCYEVACLAMTEEQAVQSSSNVVEALGKMEGDAKQELFMEVQRQNEQDKRPATTPWQKG